MKQLLYFDNAATTYPKPNSVMDAVLRAMQEAGGNPGRSAHALARKAEETVFAARCDVADFFGSDAPERVVFTYNATYALNLAIRALATKGAHILTTNLEHNSVLRPIAALKREGVCDYTAVSVYEKDSSPKTDVARILNRMKSAQKKNTAMVVCTHASNICSFSLPLTAIGDFCHRNGLLFVVDASQSAGILPIDAERMHIDALCFPAHKSLYGISGCGGILFSKRIAQNITSYAPLIYGGSGVYSKEEGMPEFLPERFEGGSLCVPALAALSQGIRFVKVQGKELLAKEQALFRFCCEHLCAMPHLRVFAPQYCGSTLLFDSDRYRANEIGRYLDDCGICVRAGLHCAPLAHQALGSQEDGAVRISFGAFNSFSQLDSLLFALQSLSKKA